MSEDKYFPEDSVVKDDFYETFKDSINCIICNKVLRHPQMCMKCQKTFCKKCIDNYPNKNEKCPNGCDDPIYKDDITKNHILSKTKYECKNCGEIIFYDDIQSHLNINCEKQIMTNINQKVSNQYPIEKEEKKKLIKLKPEECDRLVNEGKKIGYLKSKKFIFNNLYNIF